jgi:hypothetical protein
MKCAESGHSTNSSICWWRIVESFQWGNLQPFSEFQGIAKMRMTDEQEYAARSELKWRRDGVDWILMHGRRRVGRVVPDSQFPNLFRSVKSHGLSDVSNLCRAKDSVLAQAIREVAYEHANDPSKCPVKRGSREEKSPTIRSFARPLSAGLST